MRTVIIVTLLLLSGCAFNRDAAHTWTFDQCFNKTDCHGLTKDECAYLRRGCSEVYR